MNTFIPAIHLELCPKYLDKRRCWKQVVEAHQIFNTITGKSKGWINHPAVKMWEGHLDYLKMYFNDFLTICRAVHKIQTQYVKYHETIYLDPPPWWLGNEDFHRAMRARLIEKDRDFYLPKFPEDEGFNGGKYLWPVMNTKTFKIILFGSGCKSFFR